MRLPDGSRSRAVLLGTSRFQHLPPVPAVANNAWGLRQALIELSGLPEQHCTLLVDEERTEAIGAAMAGAARTAEDLLLVYYAGHGLVSDSGSLHLALPQTDRDILHWTSVPIEHLVGAVRESAAANRVLILDCCFSGYAVDVLTDTADTILGQIRILGTYTLTSSPANAVSYAFEGRTYTEFTGTMLDILWHGTAHAGGLLTLDDIYLELKRWAWENGFPDPRKCSRHTADRLALAPNAMAVPDVAPGIDQLDSGAVDVPEGVDSYYTNPLTGRLERPERVDPVDNQSVSSEPVDGWTPEHAALVEIARDARLEPEDVRAARFNPTRVREGYEEDEVDMFLDQVEDALALDLSALRRLRPSDIETKLFTPVRLRPGYDMGEVDVFLDRARDELTRRWEIAERHLGPQ